MSDVILGTVTQTSGQLVSVERGERGTVTIMDTRTGIALTFHPGSADKLRELLGRAAMPGQPAAGGPPHLAQPGESHCMARDSGYACTAQDGHAPPHQAHNTASQVVHSWGDDA